MVDEYDLSSVRQVFSGAAPLSAELAAEAGGRLGCEVVQGYGMTELSPVSHITPTGGFKPGSVGVTAPNTETLIVDPLTGDPVEGGVDGEVWVRGPQVMTGYLNNPEATAATIDADGWLHTGDIGHLDEDGHLYVVDRLKELIKFKGFQVAPAELEGVLLSHPAVADAAVVGLPDEEAGEVPVGFVVLKPDRSASGEDILAFVAGEVASFKQLRQVVFIDAVPEVGLRQDPPPGPQGAGRRDQLTVLARARRSPARPSARPIPGSRGVRASCDHGSRENGSRRRIDQDPGVAGRGRLEGAAGHAVAELDREGAAPAGAAGRAGSGPPSGGVLGQDQVGGAQPAARLQQPAQEGGGDAEGRVGDDVVGLAGEPEVGRVGLHDDDGVAEPLPQLPGSARVDLDRHHPRAAATSGIGDGAGAGTDVEDDGAAGDVGVSDEALRPSGVELVEPPPRRWRGHGRGPSSWWARRSVEPVRRLDAKRFRPARPGPPSTFMADLAAPVAARSAMNRESERTARHSHAAGRARPRRRAAERAGGRRASRSAPGRPWPPA